MYQTAVQANNSLTTSRPKKDTQYGFFYQRMAVLFINNTCQLNTSYPFCLVWFWRYLTRGLIWHLSQTSIRPSIYFSSIVKSRSNPYLEPTSTMQPSYLESFSPLLLVMLLSNFTLSIDQRPLSRNVDSHAISISQLSNVQFVNKLMDFLTMHF